MDTWDVFGIIFFIIIVVLLFFAAFGGSNLTEHSVEEYMKRLMNDNESGNNK